jgi:hypothetical protein
MMHESLPRDMHTEDEFRRIVTSLRRSTRVPEQATASPVPGENDRAFDAQALMPDVWKRVGLRLR